MRHFYFNFIRNLDSKPLISIIFACLLGGMSLQIMAEDSDNETKTIRVVKVTSQPISSMIFFPGRNAPAIAEALNQSNIPAQINAVLAQLEVKVGQTFNQGDVLARLNCQDQDLEVTNQKAQYDSANEQFKFEKRQLVRGKKLAKNRSIGEAELDNLQTNLAVSQSQLVVQKSQFNVAELNQERCLVRAPFDGIISQRIASEGEMLTVGSPIVEAVEIGRIEISADISLNDSASFEEAKEYYFESNGVRHSLVKRVLLPLVLNESRSRQARLDFIEPAAIAGMTGRLFWFTRERYLPANLLQSRGANRGFFIIENNKAKFIVIEGAQEGRPIKLSDQYSSQSAQLIIDGRHGLIDGQRVEVPNSGVGSSDEHSGKSVAKGGAQ